MNVQAANLARAATRARFAALAVCALGDPGPAEDSEMHCTAAEPRAQDLVIAYIEHCRSQGMTERLLLEKSSNLRGFLRESGEQWRSSDALAASMRLVVERGRSARTANIRRLIIRSWGDWAVERQLIDSHPFADVQPLSDREAGRWRSTVRMTIDPDAHKLMIAYIEHCRLRGLSPRHILQKESHLRGFLCEAGKEWRSSDALLKSMRSIVNRGRGARTANFRRQAVRAWGSWAFKHDLLDSHPFAHVPPLDERGDRRYVRRALTDSECDRLLAHARSMSVDRHAFYAAALYAGLRRSELFKLRWRAIDFDAGTLTVEDGKAKRVDTLPIAPALAEALRAMVRRGPADRVFPTLISDPERKADFEAAEIPVRDERGRVADLHSLRRTLHHRLIRANVVPQVAQTLMRHRSYTTTLQHYTDSLSREASVAIVAAFDRPAGGDANGTALSAWLDGCPAALAPELRRLVEMIAGSARK